jgi:hypothetical protein
MASYSRQVNIPGKTAKELYETVSKDIDQFLAKINLGKFEVDRDPVQNELRIKNNMFSAVLTCGDAKMDLSVKLSLLATPFKGKLDETITRWLSKTFNLSH